MIEAIKETIDIVSDAFAAHRAGVEKQEILKSSVIKFELALQRALARERFEKAKSKKAGG